MIKNETPIAAASIKGSQKRNKNRRQQYKQQQEGFFLYSVNPDRLAVQQRVVPIALRLI